MSTVELSCCRVTSGNVFGTGGGGWVDVKGESSMAMCRLGCRKALVLGGSLLSWNRLRKQSSGLVHVGTPFLAIYVALDGWSLGESNAILY